MKNIVLVVLRDRRYAIELRWVQEIFSLVHLTPVPTAPRSIAGAVNFRGAIVPVVLAPPLLTGIGEAPQPPLRIPVPGDTIVLLDAAGIKAGLAVDRIDEVSTLDVSSRDPGFLVDKQGMEVRLLDPPALLETARIQVGEAAASGSSTPSKVES
ncbi:MAG: chemotaxis protein CheW [Pseudomonadota bacterium]